MADMDGGTDSQVWNQANKITRKFFSCGAADHWELNIIFTGNSIYITGIKLLTLPRM